MALEWDKVTWFPNGVNQGLTAFIGGAAGDHTVPGIVEGDQIASVLAIAFATDNDTKITLPSAVTGLATEFSVSADDTLNNTGGTDTTGMLMIVQLVLKYREAD